MFAGLGVISVILFQLSPTICCLGCLRAGGVGLIMPMSMFVCCCEALTLLKAVLRSVSASICVRVDSVRGQGGSITSAQSSFFGFVQCEIGAWLSWLFVLTRQSGSKIGSGT